MKKWLAGKKRRNSRALLFKMATSQLVNTTSVKASWTMKRSKRKLSFGALGLRIKTNPKLRVASTYSSKI